MSVYSVLGAGNGGQALAAVLSNAGYKVHLWDINRTLIGQLSQKQKIVLKGAINVEANISLITNNITDAVCNSELIFVVVPANAHSDIAKLIAKIVEPHHIVILNPGRTAGALEFTISLKENGCKNLPTVAETQSLLFACRAKLPGLVEIMSKKRTNLLSCIPKDKIEGLKKILPPVYESLSFAKNSLYTGLENIGAMLHPAPVLLNTGWIESRESFFPHYYHGISRSIAKFLEKMDKERLAVAKAYGVSVRSVKKWHEENYGCVGSSLYETLQLNSAYASLDAPYTLEDRYITEDVPTGLVPISELAKVVDTPTPTIDIVISLANMITNRDFRQEGRNLKRLGLQGKTVEKIIKTF